MSYLKGSEFALTSPTFLAADGETETDCDTTPTATVASARGRTLDALTVTAAAGDGLYNGAVTTTHTAVLDRLTVTWTGDVATFTQVYTQRVDIAGGWYVSVPEVRQEEDLANAPIDLIRRKRDEFESKAEDHCGVAFVPRFATLDLRGDASGHILLPFTQLRSVVTLTVDGTVEDPTDYTVDDVYGLVKLSGTFPRSSTNGPNITVGIEHGYDCPPPELKEASLTYLRSRISGVSAGIPNNAMDGSDTTRQWAYSVPGPDKPTGIESVDEVLNRLSERIPGIA